MPSTAASLLGAFYAWYRGELAYEEAYLDLLTGRHVPVQRKLQTTHKRRGARKAQVLITASETA